MLSQMLIFCCFRFFLFNIWLSVFGEKKNFVCFVCLFIRPLYLTSVNPCTSTWCAIWIIIDASVNKSGLFGRLEENFRQINRSLRR